MLLTIAIRGAEMWTLRKIEDNCVESFETWCWRKLIVRDSEDKLDRSCEKEEVLKRLKVDGNIQHKIKRRESNWIGHILLGNWAHLAWELGTSWGLGTSCVGIGHILCGNWAYLAWELGTSCVGIQHILRGNWAHLAWELGTSCVGIGHILCGNWAYLVWELGTSCVGIAV
jgi:hypothetical protein